jgi:taurine dioxygenase|tara:strand:- start:4985 stop:5824 length:840 start_codon:yes stop_codon:yes gene_type:complete
MTIKKLRIVPGAEALGAEISGINLCKKLSSNELIAIKQALLDYEVLFFRKQPLSPDNHLYFAKLFGDPQLHEAYPHVEDFPELTILENDEANPSKIEEWHTDMTFRECPPLGSILHGVVIPETGGDTMFTSLSAAYESLSESMQTDLEKLSATHDFSYGFKESLKEPGGRERLAPMIKNNPPVEHPLVRTHPESRKKGLFVNKLFTSHINGLEESKSKDLLDFLYSHIEDTKHTCRFSWQKDSIAFWDNRITQHKPVNDYWPQLRRMQRITIDDGNRPA